MPLSVDMTYKLLRVLSSIASVIGLISLVLWYDVNSPLRFTGLVFIALGVGGLVWEKLGRADK